MRNYFYDYFLNNEEDDHIDPRMKAEDFSTFASKPYGSKQKTGVMRNGQIEDDPSLNYYQNKAELRSYEPNAREYARKYTQDALTGVGVNKYDSRDLSNKFWGGTSDTPLGVGVADFTGIFGAPLWANEAPKFAVDTFKDVGETVDAANQYASQNDYVNALKAYGLGAGQSALGVAAFLPLFGPEARETSKVLGKSVKDLGRKVSPMGYYSAADEVLSNTQRKKGNPQAWTNEFKKGGVPDAEMNWRKVNEYLANKPNQEITKDELQNHLSQYPLRLREEIHDENGIDADTLRQSERENIWESARQGDFDDQFNVEYNQEADEYNLLIDGNEVDSFATEEIARERGRDAIARNYSDAVDDISDDELFSNFDTNPPEQTSRYMDTNNTRPKGGGSYQEQVLTFNPKDIKNITNENIKFKKYGGVHPDDRYEFPIGWNLTEDYRDRATGEKIQVLHELQSKMGQTLAGQKKPLNPQDLQEIEDKVYALSQQLEEKKYNVVSLHMGNGKEPLVYELKDIEDNGIKYIVGEKLKDIETMYADVRQAEDKIRYLSNGTLDTQGKNEEDWKNILKKYTKRIEESKKNLDEYLIKNNVKDKVHLLNEDKYRSIFDARNTHQNEMDALRLQLSDYVRRVKDEKSLAPSAPLLENNSGMDPLIKRAFTSAAEENMDALAVSDYDRLLERWGDEGVASLYPREQDGKIKGKISDIMLKLARQHNPNAKLEKFYPAGSAFSNDPVPFERLNERPYPSFPEETWNAEPDLPFGDQASNAFDPSIKNWKDVNDYSGKYSEKNNKEVFGSPIEDITAAYVTPIEKHPVYQTNVAKDVNAQMVYKLVDSLNNQSKVWFATREKAEEAQRIINEALGNRNKEAPDKYIEEWTQKNGSPYYGVRLTPEMRESILKNGFSLFALANLIYWPLQDTQNDNALSYQNQFAQ